MKNFKYFLFGFVLTSAFLFFVRKATGADELPVRIWQFGDTRINRIHDGQTGVVCYVIPQSHCMGDCAYSPTMSCIKL